MYRTTCFSALLLLALASVLLSCHSKNHTSIPKGIIQPDTMMVVLSEAHIIQAGAQQGFSPSAKDTTIQQAYESMLKKHGINDSIYVHSMQFYCSNAQLLDSIYEKVLNNLNQQKIELMGPKTNPAK